MAQEQKQLLLQDLCSRLPYGVFVEYDYGDGVKRATKFHGNYLYLMMLGKLQWKDFKPYLRPMSSMTEEEKKEFIDATDGELRYSEVFDVIKPMCESEDYCPSFVSYLKAIDWLNAHHFDFRGLTSLGLTIAVTDENNPYKE